MIFHPDFFRIYSGESRVYKKEELKMKKENQRDLYIGSCLLIAFAVWTALVKCIDVKEVGPLGSKVGFSAINQFVHGFTGTNMWLYNLTDWLGLVPIAVAMCFAILGLIQLIKRKRLLAVDCDILLLGVFYIITASVFLLFEAFVVNYRPVLINGHLEASYPSSTTMLVMCVMPTALIQLNCRMKNQRPKRFVSIAIIAFIAFMVIGRLLSGVHWITDIIGGALFSTGLVLLYRFLSILN